MKGNVNLGKRNSNIYCLFILFNCEKLFFFFFKIIVAIAFFQDVSILAIMPCGFGRVKK